MAYEIRWSKKSVETLRKLDNKISKQVVKKVDSIQENPMRFLEHLVNIDCFKLRVGDYRVFIDLEINNKIMFVRVVRHRDEAYKRLLQILAQIREQEGQ